MVVAETTFWHRSGVELGSRRSLIPRRKIAVPLLFQVVKALQQVLLVVVLVGEVMLREVALLVLWQVRSLRERPRLATAVSLP